MIIRDQELFVCSHPIVAVRLVPFDSNGNRIEFEYIFPFSFDTFLFINNIHTVRQSNALLLQYAAHFTRKSRRY